MSLKKRLFADMDGVLAEFRLGAPQSALYSENYFLSLRPNPNVVEAILNLHRSHSDKIEVYIISAVLTDSRYALGEKIIWLAKNMPEIPPERYIFPPCGQNKANYIPDGIRPSDCLLDDFSKNLLAWNRHGNAVKLLNGINGNNGTWSGNSLSILNSSEQLADKLFDIIVNNASINEQRPQDAERK